MKRFPDAVVGDTVRSRWFGTATVHSIETYPSPEYARYGNMILVFWEGGREWRSDAVIVG